MYVRLSIRNYYRSEQRFGNIRLRKKITIGRNKICVFYLRKNNLSSILITGEELFF